jgi:16S rRNA (uracil1498-N3)-methyltransferase
MAKGKSKKVDCTKWTKFFFHLPFSFCLQCSLSDDLGCIITLQSARRNEMLPFFGRCLIIGRVTRRIHVSELRAGLIDLPADQAHHLRDVLRLGAGESIELFDDTGNVAEATIVESSMQTVRVRVDVPRAAAKLSMQLTVAAAVPKGDRADWMVEKLSELGVSRFIPLATARSVVLPEGRNKRERWMRLATESAKQSRRPGVMRIAELTPLKDTLGEGGWCFSIAAGARPIVEMLAAPPPRLTVFIGPEGGWTDDELRLFCDRGIAHVSLTQSILRVETAAIAAAAVLACGLPSNLKSKI